MDFSYLSSRKSAPSVAPRTAADSNQQLAVSYVNFQQWEQPYETDEAFEKGTLFPSLWLPFERE